MGRLRLISPFALAALALAACGGGSTTTVTTTTAAPTTTPTTTPTTPTTTTTHSTTVAPTSSTATNSASCTSPKIYDSVARTCVTPNPTGNPCPKGEVPMADRPVCVKP